MNMDQRARVLVVDDEPHLRELLADALGDSGMDITTAGSGAEALELARSLQPDLLVTDLCLGDCTGLDVIDRLRSEGKDLPAVVITGQADVRALSEASRRRPIEMLSKPLDLQRLRDTIQTELTNRQDSKRQVRRTQRLRKLAHELNHKRKAIGRQFDSTCSELTASYRKATLDLSVHKLVMQYQSELLEAQSDDDVFRALFGMFARKTGVVFGAAMVCDSEAQLQLVGRFGVPSPDGPRFCQELAKPVIDAALGSPKVTLSDAGDSAEQFDASIRRYLPGLTILSIPLMPTDGEMIGLVLLYRKGEQPFSDVDLTLAEMISKPTALAVRKND